MDQPLDAPASRTAPRRETLRRFNRRLGVVAAAAAAAALVSTLEPARARAQPPETIHVSYPLDFAEGYNSSPGRREYRSTWIERVVTDVTDRPIVAWVGGRFVRSVRIPLIPTKDGARCDDTLTVRVPPPGVTAIRWTLWGPDQALGRRTKLRTKVSTIGRFVYERPPGAACGPGRPVQLAVTNDNLYWFDTLSTASSTQAPAEYTLNAEALDSLGRTVLRAESAPILVPRRAPLIVSVGDSYASGQGVPDKAGKAKTATLVGGEKLCKDLTTIALAFDWLPAMERKPIWLDSGHHRSLQSGPAKAARALQREWPYLTFLSFARSGARLVGWNEAMPENEAVRQWMDSLGLEPDSTRKDDLLRQLAEAKSTVGDHPIDALLISIGGNDVGFANTLTNLAKHHRTILTGQSIASREAHINERIAHLDSALYPRVNREIARQQLNVKSIFITEYPGSLFNNRLNRPRAGCEVFDARGASAATGGHAVFFSVDASEAALIDRLGQSLNRAVAHAARREGWRLIDGIDEASRGHGYCTDQPWFVHAEQSCDRQGEWSGTMHPNAAATDAMGAIIAQQVRRVLPRPGGPAAGPAGGRINP